MPEGDVLRRTAARLDQALAGTVLARAELRWPDATADLTGRTVLGTTAYGKHLLTRLDDGRTLRTHLRMDGSWRVAHTGATERAERDPWVRAVLVGPDWTALGLRLGMLDVVRTDDEHLLLHHLGPDVLVSDFATTGLAAVLDRWAGEGRPACEVLLDQTVQAGFGTIWTAEGLFARHVWPWTPAGDLRDPASLVMTARELMARSVLSQQPVRVHGRAGAPCVRCGTPIAVGTARRPPHERPIFWCPTCQTPPAEWHDGVRHRV
ncbi:DNA-formamidopyrimidine glycosylase family protein [Isoptericola sp. b441]|uniref:DNA-(apurinic or apyrimidinic site) lyase n=1 Tax=Actinotalea lenta TaxID=3064654 RepID=A0ABT9D910_9CELL|nr:DNA-formamidopyrimidine glycosylase family protein [Isoptericola sp. b441]MDO8107384.1 DNA-formamidopyrimidine glycosylase family protein [Isoptericola sp. b441]